MSSLAMTLGANPKEEVQIPMEEEHASEDFFHFSEMLVDFLCELQLRHILSLHTFLLLRKAEPISPLGLDAKLDAAP